MDNNIPNYNIKITLLFVYLQTNVCLKTYIISNSIIIMVYGINMQVQ